MKGRKTLLYEQLRNLCFQASIMYLHNRQCRLVFGTLENSYQTATDVKTLAYLFSITLIDSYLPHLTNKVEEPTEL